MKCLFAIATFLAVLASVANVAAAQKSGTAVPKYDPAAEKTFKGVVIDTSDRQCPISGGLGSHLVLKLGDGNAIEIHLASTRFVKDVELVFHKGDEISVLGTKVQFEGKEAILAREVTRGSETFVFRDANGVPVW
jgi:hypothetical protein